MPLHIIQRGNNRQACFFADDDYRFYLEWLQHYAAIERMAVHAYVLMTNRVHLLLSAQTAADAGRLLKRLGQRYVPYVNRDYRRSGTLWEGRFRSCLGQEEHYVLDPGLVDEIREATNGNYVLGTERFEQQAAAMLGGRVSRGVPGRPRKEAD